MEKFFKSVFVAYVFYSVSSIVLCHSSDPRSNGVMVATLKIKNEGQDNCKDFNHMSDDVGQETQIESEYEDSVEKSYVHSNKRVDDKKPKKHKLFRFKPHRPINVLRKPSFNSEKKISNVLGNRIILSKLFNRPKKKPDINAEEPCDDYEYADSDSSNSEDSVAYNSDLVKLNKFPLPNISDKIRTTGKKYSTVNTVKGDNINSDDSDFETNTCIEKIKSKQKLNNNNKKCKSIFTGNIEGNHLDSDCQNESGDFCKSNNVPHSRPFWSWEWEWDWGDSQPALPEPTSETLFPPFPSPSVHTYLPTDFVETEYPRIFSIAAPINTNSFTDVATVSIVDFFNPAILTSTTSVPVVGTVSSSSEGPTSSNSTSSNTSFSSSSHITTCAIASVSTNSSFSVSSSDASPPKASLIFSASATDNVTSSSTIIATTNSSNTFSNTSTSNYSDTASNIVHSFFSTVEHSFSTVDVNITGGINGTVSSASTVCVDSANTAKEMLLLKNISVSSVTSSENSSNTKLNLSLLESTIPCETAKVDFNLKKYFKSNSDSGTTSKLIVVFDDIEVPMNLSSLLENSITPLSQMKIFINSKIASSAKSKNKKRVVKKRKKKSRQLKIKDKYSSLATSKKNTRYNFVGDLSHTRRHYKPLLNNYYFD